MWIAVVMVAGHYVVYAGLGFSFPIPLVAVVAGLGLIGVGLVVGLRAASESTVRSRRDTWNARNTVLTAAWIGGIFVVFALTRLSLERIVSDFLAAAIAAAPASLLYWLLVRWLTRNAFGPVRGGQEGR